MLYGDDGLAGFDLILRNARIFDAAGSLASPPDAVAVGAGRIAAVGRFAELSGGVGPATAVIDCGGRTVIPGLVDDHCHIFATAARGTQVDCRHSAAANVAAVIAALRAALSSGGGEWVRGYGYDDSPAGLGRHLNRRDLDAVSRTRPVRVDHRSGHAVVLNSAGLAAMGIGAGSADPPGGVSVRDAAGHPDGLLLEPAAWVWPTRPAAADAGPNYPDGLSKLGRRLLRYGITAVTDAGAGNGIAKWRALDAAARDGALPLRITMMAGWNQIPELQAAGLAYGDTAGGGMLTLGHAKIMLTASGGALRPDPERLAEMVRQAHNAGYPAAIHAVEQDAVVAAALAIMDAGRNDGTISQSNAPQAGFRDRIEHCAECPPEVAELVRQSGAQVVGNPAFLHYDGERYARTVESALLPHLHPMGALYAMGVPVAFGSDAPVVEPNPWAGMAAAATRKSADGIALGGAAMPSVRVALGRHAGGRRIGVGQPADLAVVALPTVDELPAARAALTIVNGCLAWVDEAMDFGGLKTVIRS